MGESTYLVWQCEADIQWLLLCIHSYRRIKPTLTEVDTYTYTCRQDEAAKKTPELIEDPEEQRDRDYMDRYNCHGQLRLTINSKRPTIARVVLIHELHHDPYCNISLPPEIKALIHNSLDSTAKDVSIECSKNGD